MSTIDLIDLPGVDSDRRFRARLEEPVQSAGEVILPKGTDIFLKASRKQGPGMPPDVIRLAIFLDYATLEGKQIPLASREVVKVVRTKGTAKGDPNDLIAGRRALSAAQQKAIEAAAERDSRVAPQTRLYFFMAVSGSTQ